MPRKHEPLAREEFAREDCHDQFAGFGGAPPARSALTLRLILAGFGLVICALGAAAFVVVTSQPVIAGVFAFFAAVAAADLIVVARRKRRGEPGSLLTEPAGARQLSAPDVGRGGSGEVRRQAAAGFVRPEDRAAVGRKVRKSGVIRAGGRLGDDALHLASQQRIRRCAAVRLCGREVVYVQVHVNVHGVGFAGEGRKRGSDGTMITGPRRRKPGHCRAPQCLILPPGPGCGPDKQDPALC